MKTKVLKSGTELPLMDLKGKPYLQVAHRIVWFREERPLWGIDTKIAQLTDTHVVVEASIHDEAGRLIARDRKREDAKHFPDFIEKATTGAIGRALALCGFGTQFDPTLDEGERLADSPVSISPTRPPGTIHSVASPSRPGPSVVVNGAPIDLAAYRVSFGKYKDKTLDDIGIDQAEHYVKWLIDNAKAKGTEMGLGAKEFIAAVQKYRELVGPRAPKTPEPTPPAQQQDLSPPPGWDQGAPPFEADISF